MPKRLICIYLFFPLLLCLISSRPIRAEEFADPLYIETTVSKSEVWVGEPLLWRCCLWRCVDLLSNPGYLPPTTAGFVALAAPQHDRDEYKWGRRYVGNELYLNLIPQSAGTHSIGSVQIRVPRFAIDMMAMVEFADFFEGIFKNTGRFEGSGGGQALLASAPIDIRVKPLPVEGRPACFSGAVGRYTVSSELDRTELRADEPLTLTLRIKGKGNIALIEAPENADFAGFRLLQQRAKGGFAPFELNSEDAILAGSALAHMAKPEGERLFIYTLMAEDAGKQQITPPTFAYFDPELARYITITSQPLSVNIKPGLANERQLLGPLPLPAERNWYLVGKRDMPCWLGLAMVCPVLGIILWCWEPQKRLWTIRYMQNQLKHGWDGPDLWREWVHHHLPRELSTSQALEALRSAGACEDDLSALEILLKRGDFQRFGGLGEAADARDEAWDELPSLLEKIDCQCRFVEGKVETIERFKWYTRHRRSLALAVTSLALVALMGNSLWGYIKDSRCRDWDKQTELLFSKGDLSGAERCMVKSFACHGRRALLDYNLGCVAWQRGEYYWAHYLFTKACRESRGCSEYVEAWKDSANKLQLQSWRAPDSALTWWPLGLWSAGALIGMLCWSGAHRRCAIACWVVAGASLLVLAVSAIPKPLAIVRAEAVVRSGPAARYEELARTRLGTLAWITEECAGYVRLQAVVGQDLFYTGEALEGEIWAPKESLEKI